MPALFFVFSEPVIGIQHDAQAFAEWRFGFFAGVWRAIRLNRSRKETGNS